MFDALREAFRQLTRFEAGTRTLLREVDDDPLIFNATHSESEGVTAEGPELHFIANEAELGLLDDEAEWELG